MYHRTDTWPQAGHFRSDWSSQYGRPSANNALVSSCVQGLRRSGLAPADPGLACEVVRAGADFPVQQTKDLLLSGRQKVQPFTHAPAARRPVAGRLLP